MNRQLKKLVHIATKETRTIIGLMSGTSLDGLDIAVCAISGRGKDVQVSLLHFQTIAYSTEFRGLIKRVYAKETIRHADLSGLHRLIAEKHAVLVNRALADWGIAAEEVDLLTSHGQTVFHVPSPTLDFSRSTLQIGDGDHLAVRTGIITLSDFRQKHLAAGGQGAPLTIYGDFLLFSSETDNRVLINLGGIANYTFLPSSSAKDLGAKIFATDIGPANVLLNLYTQAHFQMAMDEDASFASRGLVNKDLLAALLNHSFFELEHPKTTGPELFNLEYLAQALRRCGMLGLEKQDVLATLTAFTAAVIKLEMEKLLDTFPSTPHLSLYFTGGGTENPLLMSMIKASFCDNQRIRVLDFKSLGYDPEAKEAVLFALLANEAIVGDPECFVDLQGHPPIAMGKVSLP